MKNVTVIGCGVIGLTTAIHLERAGYSVKIVTNKLHFRTTSAIAAAIWMPFKAEPADLVNQWSLETYSIFKEMSKDPITGVSMVDFNYLLQEDISPDWKDAIPAEAIRKADKKELPKPYQYGYIARVPLIETPIYLEYLFDEFRGEIIMDEVLSFEELRPEDGMVINCTGLGSRLLLEDKDLYPVKGQVVKVKRTENILYAADDHPDHFFYIIPRKDCIVLGGTAEAHQYNTSPSKAATQKIISNAQKIAPELKSSEIIIAETGLRPYRHSIRLEKEPDKNIIHNYGHGGSGFTVSWACANAVLKLVEKG